MNIFWQDITDEMVVVDLGSSYSAHLPNGAVALVYWDGRSAVAAQLYLRDRAKRDQCKLAPSG